MARGTVRGGAVGSGAVRVLEAVPGYQTGQGAAVQPPTSRKPWLQPCSVAVVCTHERFRIAAAGESPRHQPAGGDGQVAESTERRGGEWQKS